MTKKKQVPPSPQLSTEEAFWIEYPDAPYLLKVGDYILLASSEQKANDLARMAGVTAEKIFNPNLKTSTTDATS